MDNIKDVVGQVMGKLYVNAPQTQQRIDGVLSAVLNEKEKQHVALSGLKDGKLFIHVDSSAWLFHMKTKQNRLLQDIQRTLPEIENIYFKIGKVT